jgi:hypothetical protein
VPDAAAAEEEIARLRRQFEEVDRVELAEVVVKRP